MLADHHFPPVSSVWVLSPFVFRLFSFTNLFLCGCKGICLLIIVLNPDSYGGRGIVKFNTGVLSVGFVLQ